MPNSLGGCKKILGYLEWGYQFSWGAIFPVTLDSLGNVTVLTNVASSFQVRSLRYLLIIMQSVHVLIDEIFAVQGFGLE